MNKFNCLDEHENVFKPHFLKASAGTGKTFAIEHIVTRLILEHKIPLKSILIVTFTRAATRELKLRIRQRLGVSYQALLEKKLPPECSYLKRALNSSDYKEHLKNLEEALCLFEEAQIFTIHGFCHYSLKLNAFEAREHLANESAEDQKYLELLREHIFYVLKSELKKEEFSKAQIRLFFSSEKKELSKIIDRLLSLVLKGGKFPTLPNFEELWKKFLEEMQGVSLELETIKRDLEVLGGCFKGLTNRQKEVHDEYLDQVSLLHIAIAGDQSAFDQLLLFSSLFFEKLEESNLKKKISVDLEKVASYALLLDLKEKVLPILIQAKDPTLIKLRIAAICAKRCEKVLEAYELSPPDDILKKMQKALAYPSFKGKLRASYQAALVDEFQDTDPVQWDIFETLFSREDYPLYLIGDPKQSIYGFRSADLPTYLKAEKTFKPENRKSLSTNFRSNASLLETLNWMFSRDNWLSEDGSLEYENVSAGRVETSPLKQSAKDKSVNFFLVESKSQRSTIWPPLDIEENHVFPWVAKRIWTLVENKSHQFEEIAILIKDRFQAKRLEAYLKKCKIPSQTKSKEHLCTTKSYTFVLALLEALRDPFNLSIVKKCLAHPYFQFSVDIFINQMHSHAFTSALLKIRELSEILFEMGFANFWGAFLKSSFKGNQEDFSSAFLKSYSLQEYLDLTKLSDLLLGEEALSQKNVDGCISFLKDLAQVDSSEDERVKRPQLMDLNAVQIMTTHSSKGLEFDVVFALGTSSRSSHKEAVIKVKKESEDTLDVFDESNQEHVTLLKEKNLEKARLLYVALTRAKERVYIPVCFESSKSLSVVNNVSTSSAPIEDYLIKLAGECSIEAIKSCITRAQDQVSIGYSLAEEEALSESYLPSFEEVPEILEPKPFTKSFREEYIASYSSICKVSHSYEEKLEHFDSMSLLGLPMGAQTGVVVHQLLEKVFEEDLFHEKNEEDLKQLIKMQCALTHLEGYEPVIKDLILKLRFLKFTCNERVIQAQDLNARDLLTESQFALNVGNGQKFKGFMDLIFIKDSQFYLVDWKTSYLGPSLKDYSQDKLRVHAEKNGYRVQASLYGFALLQYLEKKQGITFGGAFYIYLRALEREDQGALFFSPQELNLEKSLFASSNSSKEGL